MEMGWKRFFDKNENIKDLPMYKNTSTRIETILYELVRLWKMFE